MINEIKRYAVLIFGRPIITKLTLPFYIFKAKIRTQTVLNTLSNTGVLLQIGCGYRPFSNWINLDIVHGYADVVWDVRKSLPFKNNSIEAIFCEHVIEHLTKNDAAKLLSECLRVLQIGGVARFSTPDAEKYILSYAAKDDFLTATTFGRKDVLRMDIINKVMRENGAHQWVYDSESLTYAFSKAGFRIVNKAEFGVSAHVMMCNIDSVDRSFESMYIEGIK